jgi:hypothetical protein
MIEMKMITMVQTIHLDSNNKFVEQTFSYSEEYSEDIVYIKPPTIIVEEFEKIDLNTWRIEVASGLKYEQVFDICFSKLLVFLGLNRTLREQVAKMDIQLRNVNNEKNDKIGDLVKKNSELSLIVGEKDLQIRKLESEIRKLKKK